MREHFFKSTVWRYCSILLVSVCFVSTVHAKINLNDLVVRGINNGSFIQKAGNTSYFLISHKQRPVVIALHDVDKATPLYKRDLIFQSINGEYMDIFTYPPEMLNHFKQHLLPVISSKWPNEKKVTVWHYNARVLLHQNKDTPRKLAEFESPLFWIAFRKIDAEWNFLYGTSSSGTKVDYIVHRKNRDFNSLKDALAYRNIAEGSITAAIANQPQAEALREAQAKAVLTEQARKKEQENRLRATRRAKAIKAAEASRQKGIVYRSKRYWHSVTGLKGTRSVFEGDFKSLSLGPKFMIAYIENQSAYSAVCSAYLPRAVDKRIYTSQVVHVDGYGFEMYRDKPQVTEVSIDPRFTDKYDEYKSSDVLNFYYKRKALEQMSSLLLDDKHPLKQIHGNSFGNHFENLADDFLSNNSYYQMMKLVQHSGCSSSTLYQLRENFWRAAHGKPSLQADKVIIKNAEKDSESAEDVLYKNTFLYNCVEENPKQTDWCVCMIKKARHVLSFEEQNKYSDDFSQYVKLNERKSAQDAEWSRKVSPFRKCKKQ